MKMLIRAAVLLAATLTLSAQDSPVARVRSWRALHEPQILRELFDLVAIPNVASDKEGIARNAQALMRMFEKRRFLPETIPTSGSPVVLAERRAPNSTRTLTFYFHYDGQPVEAREWTNGPPFSPIIVAGADASSPRLTQCCAAQPAHRPPPRARWSTCCRWRGPSGGRPSPR